MSDIETIYLCMLQVIGWSYNTVGWFEKVLEFVNIGGSIYVTTNYQSHLFCVSNGPQTCFYTNNLGHQ